MKILRFACFWLIYLPIACIYALTLLIFSTFPNRLRP